MAKVIHFEEITFHNFKDISDLTITAEQLGNVMRLTGENGSSKTSIAEGPVWCMRGKDLLNKEWTSIKYSPRPANYPFDSVSVALIMSVDDIAVKIMREIDTKGKNVFYVNDVPVTATNYDDFINSLFVWEEFLTLYNPAFFFTMEWAEQRKMIMKYVSKPLNAAVFDEMSGITGDPTGNWNLHAVRLQEEFKKQNVTSLEAIYKKAKTDKDDLHKKAVGVTAHITKQISEYAKTQDFNIKDLTTVNKGRAKQIAELEEEIKKDNVSNQTIKVLKVELENILSKVLAARVACLKIHGEVIAEDCPTCERSLDETAVKAVKDNKQNRYIESQIPYKELLSLRDEKQKEVNAAIYVDVSDKQTEINTLKSSMAASEEFIRKQTEKDSLSAQLAEAKGKEAEHLKSKNDSIFILEAIKSFNSTEATLQASQVEKLFTRLKVRLSTHQANGTEIPAFMIQMDSKDFSSLSQGEKIAAGLELHEVIHGLNSLIVPCVIDGAGEYTGEIKVYGQAIICTAIKGIELHINGKAVV